MTNQTILTFETTFPWYSTMKSITNTWFQTFSSSCWLMVMAWKHNKTKIDRYLKQIIATGKRLHKDISKCFGSLPSKDQLSEKKLACNLMPGALATAEILFSLKMLKIKPAIMNKARGLTKIFFLIFLPLMVYFQDQKENSCALNRIGHKFHL